MKNALLAVALLAATSAPAQLAIVRSAKAAPVSSSSINFSFPTAPAAGNLIVVGFGMDGTRSVVVPTGWTLISGRSANGGSLYDLVHSVVSGDPASFTFTLSDASNVTSAGGYEIQGAFNSYPVDVLGTSQQGTNVNTTTTASVTPTVISTLPIVFGIQNADMRPPALRTASSVDQSAGSDKEAMAAPRHSRMR